MITQTAHAFGSSEICDSLGVTYRKLDYWDHNGLISPSVAQARGQGYGRERLYSLADVVLLETVHRLRDGGIGFKKVRSVIGLLKAAIKSGGNVRDITILYDGTTMFVASTPDDIITMFAPGRLVSGIAMAPIVDHVVSLFDTDENGVTLADVEAEIERLESELNA